MTLIDIELYNNPSKYFAFNCIKLFKNYLIEDKYNDRIEELNKMFLLCMHSVNYTMREKLF